MEKDTPDTNTETARNGNDPQSTPKYTNSLDKRALNGIHTRFTKENPKPGPGRTAGYKHFQATLFTRLLEDKNEKGVSFVEEALEVYKRKVRSGDRTALTSFINATALNPEILNKLDGILSGQKQSDLKFLRYQLWERCFDEQQEVLNSRKPIKLLVCGRRAGKTEAVATAIVQTAISNNTGDVVYIGKTYSSAAELIWKRVLDLLGTINIPCSPNRTEQTITLGSGVVIYVRGANSLADIDKLRGHAYRLAVIDEIQSLAHLRILVDEVLGPALRDFKGTLILSGTPPRIKGTYMESLWESAGNGDNKFIKRFHWTAEDNVFMPENETILKTVLEQNGWDKSNPVYQREWLGKMGVYDYDALVFHPTVNNSLLPDDLAKWISTQNPHDLFYSAGLDLGFDDSDAFVIILGSSKRPEKWIVWEHKRNKQDISQLVAEIRRGLEYINTEPLLKAVSGVKSIKIFTDTGGGGKKIATELRQQFKINTVEAIKQNKDLAIAQLAEEIRLGRLKFPVDGIWSDECQKIIYERTDSGELTKLIDNDAFHPDFMDCLLYALRPLWLSTETKLGDTYTPPDANAPKPSEPSIFDQMGSIHSQDQGNKRLNEWEDVQWEDI